jgi:hypothetical protein
MDSIARLLFLITLQFHIYLVHCNYGETEHQCPPSFIFSIMSHLRLFDEAHGPPLRTSHPNETDMIPVASAPIFKASGKQKRLAGQTAGGPVQQPGPDISFSPKVMEGFLNNPQQWLRRERNLLQSDRSGRRGSNKESTGQMGENEASCHDVGYMEETLGGCDLSASYVSEAS